LRLIVLAILPFLDEIYGFQVSLESHYYVYPLQRRTITQPLCGDPCRKTHFND